MAFSSNRHISEKLSKIDDILTRPFTKILNFNVSTSVLNMKFARRSKRCEIDFGGFWWGPRFRRASNHVRTVQSPDRPQISTLKNAKIYNFADPLSGKIADFGPFWGWGSGWGSGQGSKFGVRCPILVILEGFGRCFGGGILDMSNFDAESCQIPILAPTRSVSHLSKTSKK